MGQGWYIFLHKPEQPEYQRIIAGLTDGARSWACFIQVTW